MCGPHLCPMKVTEDVRKYAAEEGICENEAFNRRMREKATELASGAPELYAHD